MMEIIFTHECISWDLIIKRLSAACFQHTQFMGEIEALAVVQHTILHVYRIHSRNFLLFFWLVFFCFVFFFVLYVLIFVRNWIVLFHSASQSINQQSLVSFSLRHLVKSGAAWVHLNQWTASISLRLFCIYLQYAA